MRVAILSPLFESVPPQLYGGTERVVANLCRGLMQAQCEVVLFASGDSSVATPLVPVIERAIRLSHPRIMEPSAHHIRMLAMVAEQASNFDVIHNHHDYWMLPLSQMTKAPLLTTCHGRLDLPFLGPLFSSYSRCPLISISNHQRIPLPRLNWMKTIYHGIELDDFTFCREPGKYLAFLGRICPDKRPEWAIQIAQSSGVPLKIAAKIEGEEGQNYYDAFVKPHVDGKFIEYVGEISESEKSSFLSNALALVFPIDWPEPFGLVMVEAWACGTPVLARPCGSVPELINEGVTGYSDMSLDVLSERVKDLEKINRYECRAWVRKRFSIARMTEDYIHVYRTLIEQGYPSHSDRWDFVHPLKRASQRDPQDQL